MTQTYNSDSDSSDSDTTVETGRKMWSEMVRESLDNELDMKHGINYRKSLNLELQRAAIAIKEKRLKYPLTLPMDPSTWEPLGKKPKLSRTFPLENDTDSEYVADLEFYQEPKHLDRVKPRLIRPPLCRMAAHTSSDAPKPLPEVGLSNAFGVKGPNLIMSGDLFVDLSFIQEGVYNDPQSECSYHIRKTAANLIITCVIKDDDNTNN